MFGQEYPNNHKSPWSQLWTPLPMFGQEYPHQLCNLAYIQEILEGLHLDFLTTYKMSDIGFDKKMTNRRETVSYHEWKNSESAFN